MSLKVVKTPVEYRNPPGLDGLRFSVTGYFMPSLTTFLRD